MKNPLLLVIVALLLTGIGIGGYFLYRAETSGAFDERLQTALQSVEELKSYEMTVETRTVVSERLIRIAGLYKLDYEAKRYGSYATTTISTPERLEGLLEHTFSLQNLSLADDLYVKIETDSPLLRKTIPHSAEWRHFTGATIPPQFNNIAVLGPVLDSLAILGSHGTYLSLRGEPRDLPLASSTVHVYTFVLSKKAAAVTGGTLKSLIQRIATGTVEVFIDDAASVKSIVVNGDGYNSTSTILSVNTPVMIETPAQVE